MSNVTQFPTKRNISAHYREISSFTDGDKDSLRIVLAKQDEEPDVVHVLLIGEAVIEVIETFRDTEAGRRLADLVGKAADRTLFYSIFYGDD